MILVFVHVSDGFPTKKAWMGVGGWGELYPSLFRFFELFKLCKAQAKLSAITMA